MLGTVCSRGHAWDHIVLSSWRMFYVINIQIFWDLVLYCVVSSSRCFKLWCLHLRGLNILWNVTSANPVTQCHVPEYLNLQQHFYGNFKCCIVHNVCAWTVWYVEVIECIRKPEFTPVALLKIFTCITAVISASFYCKLKKNSTEHYCMIVADWYTE
jgi:hypothetical protein